MRVFDGTKTIELTAYDLEKGYLKDDKRFIKHHETIEETPAISAEEVAEKLKLSGETIKKIDNNYYKVVRVSENGAQVERINPIPSKPKIEAYDEYEDIQLYVPYTVEELEKIKAEKYESLVSQYIRKKYSLNAELAILRQRDTKQAEFIEYNNYAEDCKAKAKAEIEEE